MRAARAATVGASKISLNEKTDAKTRPQTRKHLSHREGIRAEREDVLVDADFVELQEVRPDLGQLPLQFRAGRNHFVAAFHPRPGRRYGKRGDEFATLDLSTWAFGISGTIRIRPGTLNLARRSLGEAPKALCGDLAAWAPYDGDGDILAKSRMGTGKAAASTTSGWLSNTSSTSAGATFCPPRLMTSFLDPADNEQISLGVEVSEVAGSEPAVPKRGLCSCGIVVVAPGDGGTPQRDFSAFAGWKPSTVVVHDRDLGPGGLPDRTRLASLQRVRGNLRGGFRHAVGLDHGNAEQGFQLAEHVDRQRRRGGTDESQG